MLKPFKHKKISDQIFEQIRDMIYRGEFSPGERLMSERELAQLFQVGRPTVREAIQKLIEQNLIQSKRGVGTFVLDETEKSRHVPLLNTLINDDFSFTDLLEVRLALEPKSAELAARRATEEDIVLIEKSLDRMKSEIAENSNTSMSADISYHMNIAYASKNVVQIHIMKSLYDVQYYVMQVVYSETMRLLDNDEDVYLQHADIVEAIKNHDPVKAKLEMENHISSVLSACKEKNI